MIEIEKVLVVLGTDFHIGISIPRKATIVQIDVRGAQLGRRSSWTRLHWRHADHSCEPCPAEAKQPPYATAPEGFPGTLRRHGKSLDDLQPEIPTKNPIHSSGRGMRARQTRVTSDSPAT